MNKRFSALRAIFSHYKYPIVILGGLIFVVFLDEYSLLRSCRNKAQIMQLQEEIDKYNHEEKAASDQLRELQRNPKAIEKIARERYFMKADDEDIYVITHDKQLQEQINEKTK